MIVTGIDIEKAEKWIREAPPGSAVAAAWDFGIDLSLTLNRLRMEPEERLRALQEASDQIEAVRAAGRKNICNFRDGKPSSSTR